MEQHEQELGSLQRMTKRPPHIMEVDGIVESPPPRWEMLYDSGMEHIRVLEQRQKQAIEEEIAESIEQANWRSMPSPDPESASARLFDDAARRDLVRASREKAAYEDEMNALWEASVHRGKVVDLQESVERLHAKEVHDREVKRKLLVAQQEEDLRRNMRCVEGVSNPSRFDLLYSDASRRSEDKRLRAEAQKTKEDQSLRMASVHANAKAQIRRKSDVDQVSARLYAGKTHGPSHIRGVGSPTSPGGDSRSRSLLTYEASCEIAYDELEDEFPHSAHRGGARKVECFPDEGWRAVSGSCNSSAEWTREPWRNIDPSVEHPLFSAYSQSFVRGTDAEVGYGNIDASQAFGIGGIQASLSPHLGTSVSLRSLVQHERESEFDEEQNPLARSLLRAAGISGRRQQKQHQARGPKHAC